MNTVQGALDGIRALDLSRILAAPFAARLPGDLGADAIKVARPLVGDDGRKCGFPWLKDAGGNPIQDPSFVPCCNRNKRSIAIDLSTVDGQRLVRDLAEAAAS